MAAPIYVLGGYQTDFARNWNKENKHIVAMMREAVLGGLEATGIEPKDVEVGHVGNFAAELYAMQGHLGAFLVDVDPASPACPTSRHEAACASGSIAILAASAEIEAGRYDLAMVVGVEQMKTVDPEDAAATSSAPPPGTSAKPRASSSRFPKLFGRLGDEYDKRFGLKDEHLAHISAVNYSNAKRNPLAQTRNWYMTEDHARANDKFNCDHRRPHQGLRLLAGHRRRRVAVPRLREGRRRRTPRSAASSSRASHVCSAGAITPRRSSSTPRSPRAATTPTCCRTPGRRSSTPSGAPASPTCWGVNAIETHDCFTTSEYMAIDHFGLTKPGESWKAVEDGTIEMGGKMPINPSGGLIGCGHPVGATGTRQVLDAYRQVTGTAGDYQVEGAKRIATLNIGGSGTTSVSFVVGC